MKNITIARDKNAVSNFFSRPKAPKILQELLGNSEELPSPRPTKLLKNSKRFKRFKKFPYSDALLAMVRQVWPERCVSA